MNAQTIEKIVVELEDLPEEKATSLMDYLHFLRWEQDQTVTSEEKVLIREAEKEIKEKKGTNWRDIKRDI